MLRVDNVIEVRRCRYDSPPGGTVYAKGIPGPGFWIEATTFSGHNGLQPRTSRYHEQSLRKDPEIMKLLRMSQEDFNRMYFKVTALALEDLERSKTLKRVPHTLYEPSPDYSPPQDVQENIIRDLEGRLELLEVVRTLRTLPDTL